MIINKKCPHCGENMLNDGNGKYIFCRDALCNWVEFIPQVSK